MRTAQVNRCCGAARQTKTSGGRVVGAATWIQNKFSKGAICPSQNSAPPSHLPKTGCANCKPSYQRPLPMARLTGTRCAKPSARPLKTRPRNTSACSGRESAKPVVLPPSPQKELSSPSPAKALMKRTPTTSLSKVTTSKCSNSCKRVMRAG